MSTIHLAKTTSLTPEPYIAGLTDFGPGRSKVFSNSADDSDDPADTHSANDTSTKELGL